MRDRRLSGIPSDRARLVLNNARLQHARKFLQQNEYIVPAATSLTQIARPVQIRTGPHRIVRCFAIHLFRSPWHYVMSLLNLPRQYRRAGKQIPCMLMKSILVTTAPRELRNTTGVSSTRKGTMSSTVLISRAFLAVAW